MSLPKPERRPSAAQVVEPVPRERLPHPHVELVGLEQPREHLEGAEPAVLVVDGHDAPRRRHAHALARGLHHLVHGRAHVAVAEVPRRVLAQDAARLDHAARHLERRIRLLQRRAVHPERVVVLRHQRHGHVRHGPVERLPAGRLGPVALAPAEPSQPATRRHPLARGHHAVERLLERARALEARLVQAERPGGEVHVRVGEAGQHAAVAELDHPRARLVVVHHPRSPNGQLPHDGGSWVQRSDRSAGEEHRRQSRRASRPAGRRTSCRPRPASALPGQGDPRLLGVHPLAAGSSASCPRRRSGRCRGRAAMSLPNR